MMKSLNERTMDRLFKEADDMIANFRNDEWWINYYGGREQYDEMLKLAQETADALDSRKPFNEMTPEEQQAEIQAGVDWICGGPDDDVEKWGRDIVASAHEETLRQERENNVDINKTSSNQPR